MGKDENPYSRAVRKAVKAFWGTRDAQARLQEERGITDQGTRSAVTGGRQMDGFIELLRNLAVENGVPADYVHTRSTTLPGYYRPTKDWDFLIITPSKELIATIEVKSQVGSFGNNFNNRTEEALGNSEDFWTAFREGALQKHFRPWLGYIMIV